MRPNEKLDAAWASEVPPYTRSSSHNEAEVAAFEARYALKLPPDFRDYVLRSCATADDGGMMDDRNNAWWGLDRLRSVAEEYEHSLTDPSLEAERETSIFFADHMIWCMAWAIRCRPGPFYGEVFVVSGRDRVVAPSFAAFVGQYIADYRQLL